MYEIALTVAACLRSGTRVDVAWVVESDLTAGGRVPDPGEALALTPGGGRVGNLYGGALDGQLAERAAAMGEAAGRLVTVQVGALEAQAFGLDGAGSARAVLVPAAILPEEVWPLLLDRRPVALALRRGGDELTGAELLDPDAVEPTVGSTVGDERVVTVLRPVPTLVLAGGGPVLLALEKMAPLLGWRVQRGPEPESAGGLAVGLGPLDLVVVAMHDVDRAGPVLAVALSGRAGYVAALGSTTMQQARATWLADRGVSGLERIHTPAGLEIGADGPAEVAVAILAEAIAARPGRARQGNP